MMELRESYSYDDVLLMPGYSEVLPADVDVSVELLPGMRLNVPIMSAAMDTVTEDDLAIALALEGGVGVIHRNISVKEQAEQVARVKRYLNWVIEDPLTVRKTTSLNELRQIMENRGISGLPVVSDDNVLQGIVTARDMRFSGEPKQTVAEIMTVSPVVLDSDPNPVAARDKFDKYRIEKLPVVDKAGKLIGLITVKDMEKQHQFPHAAVDSSGRLLVGAAVGVANMDERVEALAAARVDFIVVDSAHGSSRPVIDCVARIKKRWGLPVIGGNVATAEGARLLVRAGADAIKVGVGPGSICTTRVVTGVGVPQFSALLWVAEGAGGLPIIADGGIKYSGDIVKAMAAGASAVMIGGLFAGLKEAPGQEIIYEGRIFKSYRGMGSLAAIRQGSGDRYKIEEGEKPVPEGVEGRVPFKGNLHPYLHQMVTGLRKGMGYTGCATIEELQNYRRFLKITSAGLQESHVHDVTIVQEPPNYSR